MSSSSADWDSIELRRYVTEIVRAGILAVDRGQMEAGRTLGFNATQTMRYIIMPQAVKIYCPPWATNSSSNQRNLRGFRHRYYRRDPRSTLIGTRTYDVLPPYFIASGFTLSSSSCFKGRRPVGKEDVPR